MANHIEMRREVWVDWMRIAACFLVMVVHSTEPFYFGGEGTLILTRTDAFWASFFDTFARACVPLFVVASSYLQFPLHYSTGEFLRRRAARILIPFVLWTVVYALIWGEPVQNFKDLLLNFNYTAGHLWYVYMLIGLYLLMPLLSPWAEKVGRRELLFFMAICFFTTFIPFIREKAVGDNAVFLFGPGGIPMQGQYPLWGEASWNEFGVFYYFSGFIGYLLLGLYLRKFVGELSTGRTLAIAVPCWLVGFAICFHGFLRRVFETAQGTFPVGGDVSVAAGWETPWFNNTVGVALMTIGWVLLFRLCRGEGGFYRKVVFPVSKASYGIYLCHMIALSSYATLFRTTLGIGENGSLGVMTTPAEIILTAVCSYLTVSLLCVIVQRIPKLGKWVVG